MCSAYSIADASLYDQGQVVPKPAPSVPEDNSKPDAPSVEPTEPVTPSPDQPVDPSREITAADFTLEGHPSRRRGFFGLTSYYLTVNAEKDVLQQVKSIQYAPQAGSYYTVFNGSAPDIAVSSKNLASPDFRTRARSVNTDQIIIKLRNGKSLKVDGIKVNL